MKTIWEAFHEEMINLYQRIKAESGYNATRFLQMVSERGGLEAAKTLLHNPQVSYGFEELWKRGRLDLTVEAVVLKEHWSQLFSPNDIATARKRLDELGYKPLE